MEHRYVCGIDIGTGSTRGVIIDETLRIVAEHAVTHEMSHPKPGYFEMDAEEIWWKDLCTVSRKLLEITGLDPTQIEALGISVLGCDLVPVDEMGRALRPAILYGIDSRSEAEIRELRRRYGEEEQHIVGHMLCTSDIAPKILWMKHNEPEIHRKAAKLLTGSSFLCGKLTDRYVIDPYLAEDFMPLYNLKEGLVNDAQCEGICRPDQLAELLPATSVAGVITREAAEATGFAVGMPVLCGTGDSGAEAIGSGVMAAGDMLVQLGSTCFFICLSDHEISDPRIWPGTFVIPGVWAVCGGTNTAGTLTRWFRDRIYEYAPENDQAYGEMAERIRRIPPGSEGLLFLPYPEGERTPIHDPEASGLILGLTLRHTKDHLYRAALEGIAMEIADHVDIMEENGIRVKRILVSGGGAKNETWLQIIADVTGRQIHVGEITAGACYGDALMAAAAAGWEEGSLSELSERMCAKKIYMPMGEHTALYAGYRELFHRAYEQNRELMHSLRLF